MSIHENTIRRPSLKPFRAEPGALPSRYPRCNDDLALYYARRDQHHFFGCKSYPQCSYTADYDVLLHQLLLQVDRRLTFLETQIASLMIQVEELWKRQEVQP